MENEKRYLRGKIEKIDLEIFKLQAEKKKYPDMTHFFINQKLEPKEEEVEILNNLLIAIT